MEQEGKQEGDCKGRTGQGCAIMLKVAPEGQEQIRCMVARQALQVGVMPEALRDMMALPIPGARQEVPRTESGSARTWKRFWLSLFDEDSELYAGRQVEGKGQDH